MLCLGEKKQEKGVESHPGKRCVCGKRLLEAEAIITQLVREQAVARRKHERAFIGGELLERLIELLPLEARERLDRFILPRRSASAILPTLSLGRGIGARNWGEGLERRGAGVKPLGAYRAHAHLPLLLDKRVADASAAVAAAVPCFSCHAF